MNICQYPNTILTHITRVLVTVSIPSPSTATLNTIYNIYLLGSGGHHGTQHQPPPRPHLPQPPRRAWLPGVKSCHVTPCNENICAAIIKIFAPLQVRVTRARVSVTAGATLRLSCRADTAYKRCVLVSAAGGNHPDDIISTGLHNIYWLQGRRAAGGGGAVSGAWRCRAAPAPSCGPGPSSWGTSLRGSAPSR